MTDQPKRATWRDWLPDGVPPPRVISRAELLAEIKEDRGIDLTPRTLRHWELQGALPHPVRQGYDGVAQAVYPEWMADVIVHLWFLRSRRPLRECVSLMPAIFQDEARRHAQRRRTLPAGEAPAKLLLPDDLQQALGTFVAAHGGGTFDLDIRLHDGRRFADHIHVSAPPSNCHETD